MDSQHNIHIAFARFADGRDSIRITAQLHATQNILDHIDRIFVDQWIVARFVFCWIAHHSIFVLFNGTSNLGTAAQAVAQLPQRRSRSS